MGRLVEFFIHLMFCHPVKSRSAVGLKLRERERERVRLSKNSTSSFPSTFCFVSCPLRLELGLASSSSINGRREATTSARPIFRDGRLCCKFAASCSPVIVHKPLAEANDLRFCDHGDAELTSYDLIPSQFYQISSVSFLINHWPYRY